MKARTTLCQKRLLLRLGRKKAYFAIPWLVSLSCWALWILPSQLLAEEEQDRQLPPAALRPIDFVKDVQPIFAKSCYACHGPETQEAGLRLDDKAVALAGSDSGPVILAKQSAESRLIHLVAGLDEDTGIMPPEDGGPPLDAEQIGILRAWIDQGAQWPDDARHWSFKPIMRPELPAVKNQKWVRNAIDALILAKLEQEGVEPSPEADPVTLIRRLYLDLIGLPPTPEEVDAFVANPSSEAYEQIVDQLLASPHYGERWGRYWLDAARYADTDGYEEDRGRPFAWRYRDWIIDALNQDLPFDVFSIRQLAGDLLVVEDREYDAKAAIGTGFHRNTLVNLGGCVNKEEDQAKQTIERTNALGSVWLGLTLACANCHTHKYDPITQHEYFQLYAFFNNMEPVDIPVEQGPLFAQSSVSVPVETATGSASEGKEKPDVAVEKDPTEKSSEKSKRPSKKKKKKAPPKDPEVERRSAGAATLAQAVQENSEPRATHVHERGDIFSKGDQVEPKVPAILPQLAWRGSRPDRLDLARWLFAKENPLPARVIANRLWQGHFGRGLVFTVDDFGTQGELPSHPELLDWLAAELQDGWQLKRFHRLIVTSATYRQAATVRKELLDRDPYNTWLARQNRLRVEAEIVRDLALAASGLLSREIGGPSVFPPQPSGLYDLTYAGPAGFAVWIESTGSDRYRRGVYTWLQRVAPYPALTIFDANDTSVPCTRRDRSNTPLQSLTLLNDETFFECAQVLGRRMLTETGSAQETSAKQQAARITFGYRLCVGRSPNPDEMATLQELLNRTLTIYENKPEDARLFAGIAAENADPALAAAYVAVARAMINCDEFISRE